MLNTANQQTNTDFFDSFESKRIDILEYISNFNRIGQKTEVFTDRGLTYYVNDYWTASQRQSNRLHEISYRACFKAELPNFFIKTLTRERDVVYDPFMGRGTTPLQAALMNRFPIGNDINPLSKMLLRPRLSVPSLANVMKRLKLIDWNRSWDMDEDLLTFYHPKTLNDIYTLKHWLIDREAERGGLDSTDDWIRMVAINRLTGHSSGFFSVYTLPPNQAVTVDRQKKINERRNQTPPNKDIREIIIKKSRVLMSQCAGFMCQGAILGTETADKTEYISSGSVDLVVTSPPFLDIVNYAQDNWLRCWFAGIDANKVPISIHKTVESWTGFTHRTLKELSRIVKTGGYIAYEVGEVRNKTILLEQYVAKAAKNLPLEILGIMVNQQNFTKTANCWGVKNNNKGTNSNRIVLMRRK